MRVIDDEAFAPARLIDGEVSEEEGTYSLVMRLDRPAAVGVSATIELVPQSARADQDYIPQRGLVRIPPGGSEAILSIDIIDDDIFENEERFLARIIQSEALDVLDFDAEISIINDDPPPVLFLMKPRPVRGNRKGLWPFP